MPVVEMKLQNMCRCMFKRALLQNSDIMLATVKSMDVGVLMHLLLSPPRNQLKEIYKKIVTQKLIVAPATDVSRVYLLRLSSIGRSRVVPSFEYITCAIKVAERMNQYLGAG